MAELHDPPECYDHPRERQTNGKPLLAVYWLSGALCGMLLGLPAAGLDRVFDKWASSFAEADFLSFRSPHPSFFAALPFTIPFGLVCGIFCGTFMSAAAYCIPLVRRPISAAVFCASLGGCAWLLLVPFAGSEWLAPDRVPLLLAHLAGTLAMGAAFGFVMTLLVRLIQRRLVDRSSQSTAN